MADNYSARTETTSGFYLTGDALESFARNIEALSIWMFAMMKSNTGWIFRKKYVMERFIGCGERKWKAAIRFLISLGVLRIELVRNNSGKIVGREYVFYGWDNRRRDDDETPLEKPQVSHTETTKAPKINHLTESDILPPMVKCYPLSTRGLLRGGFTEKRPSEDGMTQEEIERHRARFLSRFPGIKTFQTFDDCKEKRPGITKVFHNDTSKLEEINYYGGGIFLTVNETDGKGRRKENITRIRAIFVDLDGSPLEPVLKHNPHMVVETSQGKFHCYWFVKDFPIEAFSDTQKRLAEMFNGDPVVHDTSRVMRVPGYWHQKGEAFLSRIILEGYEEPLDYSEVVAKFPPKPVKQWSKPRYTESDENSEYKGQYGTVAGNRNNGLMKFVGGMVKRRKPWDQVESEAWKWGKGCSPPLPDHEIELLLRSARRYA